MTNETRAYFYLHISIFLWGFTAILGRLITLQEVPLVWYRVLITSLSLLLLPGVLKVLRQTPQKKLLQFAGIGCLVAVHWICFYGSIKYANISVALSCLATTSFITSFMEPLFFRTRIKGYELALGIIIIPGIILIANYTAFDGTGVVLGLLAAFFASVFTILNKKTIANNDSKMVTLVELGSGFIFLSLLMPLYLFLFPAATLTPQPADILYLLLLSIVCTLVPFVLSLQSLRHLSAFITNLSINLEPVYGIAMAIIIFNEHKELNPQFYWGTIIILMAVFLHPFFRKKFTKRKPAVHDEVNLTEQG